MKKWILCAATAAALSGTGAVLAQSAECQPGMFAGAMPPGCGNTVTPQQQYPGYGYNYGYNHGYGNGAVLSQIFGSNAYPYAYYEAPRVVPRYQPSRRDRDGDGVRNRNDRYPNDPRYR